MDTHLARDAAQLPLLLEQTLTAATAYLASIDARPPATALVVQDPPGLPDAGMGAAATLAHFLQRYGDAMPASNGPRFWGFVTGGATPAALMADWLVSAYDLNLSNAANSQAPNLEWEALSMLRALFGLPDPFGGAFVTGATMANFAGLAMGREWIARQHGKRIAQDGLQALPPFAVIGGAAHSSIFKALAMLGVGRNSYQTVSTLPGTREAVDIPALRAALAAQDGAPAIVVANAGTVNTVDFDDLHAIAALTREFPFWLHVDAAFGGFAACSPTFRHLMAGVEAADSLTIDAHKWLNVPYDAAMIFTPHRDLQVEVFQNSAAYLGQLTEPYDFVHLGPENSRRMRALPAWFTLLAYGRAGYQEIVERNCALARQLGTRIEQSGHFRLLAPVRLNVVCFTLEAADGAPIDGAQVADFLDRLRDDGRLLLTPTVFDGRPAIRAALSNWRTTAADLDIAWAALVDCLPGDATTDDEPRVD